MKTAIASSLLLIGFFAPSASAKNIKIDFGSGSFCGIYDGVLSLGDRLVVELGAGQTFTVENPYQYWNYEVKFSNGTEATASGGWGSQEAKNFRVPAAGATTVEIVGNNDGSNSGYGRFILCAHNPD